MPNSCCLHCRSSTHAYPLLVLDHMVSPVHQRTFAPLTLELVLPRFHLVRCFSSLDLLLALNALPQHLASLQGSCRILLVDNIAAYVWQDRAVVSGRNAAFLAQHQQHHQSHPAAAAGSNGLGVDPQRVHGALASLLKGLAHQFRLPVIVTKQAGVSNSERLVQREVMAPQWQSAVTHRLLLLPPVATGQVLAALARGPVPAEVSLQWQDVNFTGPIERWRLCADAMVAC
eukprot:GHRR01034224.1.p1 GENE.GHRR01034224.1~~GHRR01034224.1.p1  ORF type:complete len:230 (+),score=54.10 GHRR01034224.1:948-1637(+)